MKIGLSRIQKLATLFNATSVRAHTDTTSFSFAFTQRMNMVSMQNAWEFDMKEG
jgi:hypothetical protein